MIFFCYFWFLFLLGVQIQKLRTIYMKIIEKTEKWTLIFYSILRTQLMFTAISAVTTSYLKYFTTEEGSTSFRMGYAGT